MVQHFVSVTTVGGGKDYDLEGSMKVLKELESIRTDVYTSLKEK